MAKDVYKRQLSEDPDSLEGRLPQLVAEGKLEGAAARAIARQISKGLAITFLRGDLVIKQFPDGREELLATLTHRRSISSEDHEGNEIK